MRGGIKQRREKNTDRGEDILGLVCPASFNLHLPSQVIRIFLGPFTAMPAKFSASINPVLGWCCPAMPYESLPLWSEDSKIFYKYYYAKWVCVKIVLGASSEERVSHPHQQNKHTSPAPGNTTPPSPDSQNTHTHTHYLLVPLSTLGCRSGSWLGVLHSYCISSFLRTEMVFFLLAQGLM